MLEKILNIYKRIRWANFFELPIRIIIILFIYKISFKNKKIFIIDVGLRDNFLDFLERNFLDVKRLKFNQYSYIDDVASAHGDEFIFNQFKSLFDEVSDKLILVSPGFISNFIKILAFNDGKLKFGTTVCVWDRDLQNFVEDLNKIYEIQVLYCKKYLGLYPADIRLISILNKRK